MSKTKTDVEKVKGKVKEKGHAEHGRVGEVFHQRGRSRTRNTEFTNISTGAHITKDTGARLGRDVGYGVGKGTSCSTESTSQTPPAKP